MSRSAKALLLTVAIILTVVLLALAVTLVLSERPTDSTPLAGEKAPVTAAPPSAESTSTPVVVWVSPTPTSRHTPPSTGLPTSTLRAPTATAPDTPSPPITPTATPFPPTPAPASWALLGNKYGDLPEVGMSSFALNGRLTWNYGTTLAKEVEKILGPQTKPLTLPKVKQVIRKYLNKGIRLHRKFGRIPELDMSSYNLADRLKRNFNVTLTELVDEVAPSLKA